MSLDMCDSFFGGGVVGFLKLKFKEFVGGEGVFWMKSQCLCEGFVGFVVFFVVVLEVFDLIERYGVVRRKLCLFFGGFEGVVFVVGCGELFCEQILVLGVFWDFSEDFFYFGDGVGGVFGGKFYLGGLVVELEGDFFCVNGWSVGGGGFV